MHKSQVSSRQKKQLSFFRKSQKASWLASTEHVKSEVGHFTDEREQPRWEVGYPHRGGLNTPADGQAASTWVSWDHRGRGLVHQGIRCPNGLDKLNL